VSDLPRQRVDQRGAACSVEAWLRRACHICVCGRGAGEADSSGNEAKFGSISRSMFYPEKYSLFSWFSGWSLGYQGFETRTPRGFLGPVNSEKVTRGWQNVLPNCSLRREQSWQASVAWDGERRAQKILPGARRVSKLELLSFGVLILFMLSFHIWWIHIYESIDGCFWKKQG